MCVYVDIVNFKKCVTDKYSVVLG